MSMTVAEMGRLGGAARARALSPERRQEIARKAAIAAGVSIITRRVDDLTRDQRDQLLDALLDLDGDR
ncbi:MAG TPA: hypothetical protein VFJ69_08925 [Actinomycetota bacterium]|jgi:hypothetical protein|nr:hypothetical protein [Actinomycetota bacterium]